MSLALLKPIPGFPVDDVTDISSRDAESFGDIILRVAGLQSPDRQNVILGQFCHVVALAAIVRSVSEFVGLVFCARFPGNVTLRNAGQVSIAARVRRLMFWCWRRAIRFFANEARTEMRLAIAVRRCIAPAVLAERPLHALVAFVGHHDFAEIALPLPARRSAGERVTMLLPSAIMVAAPAARPRDLVTFFDRTYTIGFSHFRSFRDRLWSGLEPVLTHRFGPIFMPEKPNAYNYGRA